MKTILLFTLVLGLAHTSNASFVSPTSSASSCSDNSITVGGVDIWPWSFAQPFPWDNIQGYWKLGDDENSFIKAKVLSATDDRKILNISVYVEGLCTKANATGKGYIDVTEKNVVRAIVSDGVYKYQLKLGLFNVSDILNSATLCRKNVLAASMQVIGHAPGQNNKAPIDPRVTETQNMMLKKVTVDMPKDCKKN